MSADNFWMIRKDKFGNFAPLMGFASDEEDPIIQLRHPRFASMEDAMFAIKDEWTEYGTSVHPECWVDEEPTPGKREGHYLSCPLSIPKHLWYPDEDFTCRCDEWLAEWNTRVDPETLVR